MADKLVIPVGLAPTVIRTPGLSAENQIIYNPGPANMFLGQAGVTPQSGCPFPVGSESKLYKNGTPVYACVPGTVPVAGAPALPATGVAATNNTGQAVAVTVAGGTVSAIAVSGTTQSVNGVNTIAGTFVVPAGGTITVTYTVAPTTYLWQYGLVTPVLMSPGVQLT